MKTITQILVQTFVVGGEVGEGVVVWVVPSVGDGNERGEDCDRPRHEQQDSSTLGRHQSVVPVTDKDGTLI
jgi:hypothetical protein